MDQPSSQVPANVLQAVAAAMAAAAAWMLNRARKRPRTLLDLAQAKEGMREFIDERAEHKVRNALNVVVPRIDRLEDDLNSHLEQTRHDVREFYTLTGRLTAGMESLKATTEQNAERLDELVRMVGELRGLS